MTYTALHQAIDELYELNQAFLQNIETDTDENCAAYVQRRNDLFDVLQRESNADGGQTEKMVLTAAATAKISRILQWDREITQYMERLKNEATSKLGKITNTRKQRNAYSVPYQSENSVFFDQQK